MSKKKREQSPVQKAARVRLEERGKEIGQRLLRCVRPVALEIGESAELVGSSVLLDVGGRKFIATAAHVADWSAKGDLIIGGRELFYYLPPLRTTEAPAGNRDSDPYDIAVAELDPEFSAALGDIDFVDRCDLELTENTTASPFYTAVGYPVVAQNLDPVRRHFNPRATVFSNIGLPETKYRKISSGIFTPDANLAIGFDTKRVVSEGQIKALKNQHGLSGGGIWRVQSFAGGSSKDLLAGITIYAQSHGTKALVSTRMSVVLEVLKQKYPDLSLEQEATVPSDTE